VVETVIERPGALDVHKEQVTACVRTLAGRRREQHIAEFKTTVQGLLALRDWLHAHGVTHVVMYVNDRENSPGAIVRIPHLRRCGAVRL